MLLQIARKALEPPDDPREDPRDADEADLVPSERPLAGGVPQHWSSVRCACIEGVLSTAILASRHADVWDAAALLLREHWRCAPVTFAVSRGDNFSWRTIRWPVSGCQASVSDVSRR